MTADLTRTPYGTLWDYDSAIACRDALKKAAQEEVCTKTAGELYDRAEWWSAVMMELQGVKHYFKPVRNRRGKETMDDCDTCRICGASIGSH